MGLPEGALQSDVPGPVWAQTAQPNPTNEAKRVLAASRNKICLRLGTKSNKRSLDKQVIRLAAWRSGERDFTACAAGSLCQKESSGLRRRTLPFSPTRKTIFVSGRCAFYGKSALTNCSAAD